MDEIGPISLMPHGGRAWFRWESPEPIPSAYKRLCGTAYLYLTPDDYHPKLSGRFYRHKGGDAWLDYIRRECGRYPNNQRVFGIQNNLGAHWTPTIRVWDREARIMLLASATQSNWIDPAESHAGEMQELTLDGTTSARGPR